MYIPSVVASGIILLDSVEAMLLLIIPLGGIVDEIVVDEVVVNICVDEVVVNICVDEVVVNICVDEVVVNICIN